MSLATNQLPEMNVAGWVCRKCGQALQATPVDVTYMGSSFRVELPGCPTCGFIFIPPILADGKMQEVEKLLEDK